jgi:hypothetical protein
MQLLKGNEGRKVMVEVNGHMVEAVVSVMWDYEDTHPVSGEDFDFGDSQANDDYEARFFRGELSNVMVTVRVMAEGLEGLDHLGACHVTSRDFETDLMQLVNDHDMIGQASDELKTNIIEAASRLQKYAKGA